MQFSSFLLHLFAQNVDDIVTIAFFMVLDDIVVKFNA